MNLPMENQKIFNLLPLEFRRYGFLFQPECSIKILVFLGGVSFQSSYFVILDVSDLVVNNVAFVVVVVDNGEVVVNVFVEVLLLVD